MRKPVSKNVLLKKERSMTRRRTVSGDTLVHKNTLYGTIKSKNGAARVCIIRSVGGIGDVLMSTPLMLELKREFPELHLTYAVDRHRTQGDDYHELVKNLWFINEIIDARYVDRSKYDFVMDISAICIRYERKGLPQINRIDLFARACGLPKLRQKVPVYVVTPEEKLWASIYLKTIREKYQHVVLLHTASNEGKRSWVPEQQVDLLKQLQTVEGLFVLVSDYNNVLPASVKQLPNVRDISRLSLRELAALISVVDLGVYPDSGPMHIAGALFRPSLVLFGSIPPMARINYYREHEAIVLKGLSCLGCWYQNCPIQVKCMRDLSWEIVYNKILERLNVSITIP